MTGNRSLGDLAWNRFLIAVCDNLRQLKTFRQHNCQVVIAKQHPVLPNLHSRFGPEKIQRTAIITPAAFPIAIIRELIDKRVDDGSRYNCD